MEERSAENKRGGWEKVTLMTGVFYLDVNQSSPLGIAGFSARLAERGDGIAPGVRAAPRPAGRLRLPAVPHQAARSPRAAGEKALPWETAPKRWAELMGGTSARPGGDSGARREA